MRKTKTTEEEKKMKNTKKTNCKCTPNWTTYTPGKNAFGEDAYTEYIVVKRETAFEQILAAIIKLTNLYGYSTRLAATACYNVFRKERGKQKQRPHSQNKITGCDLPQERKLLPA